MLYTETQIRYSNVILEGQNEKTIPAAKSFKSKYRRGEKNEQRKRKINRVGDQERLQELYVSLYDTRQTRGYFANYGFHEQNQLENRER